MKASWKYAVLPLLAVVIWSGNTAVSKLAAGQIDPAAISFYRWFIAAIIMTPFVWRELMEKRAHVRRYWPRYALMGFFGMVAYQCFAYLAAETTTATNMGLLAGTIPLLTVALSVLLLKDRATRGELVGGLLSLVGLIYLVSAGHPSQMLTHGATVGDGIMFIACLAYAAYSVLLKHWHSELSRWASVSLQMWFSVIILLVYYLTSGMPPVARAAVPLVLYAAIPASLMAPLLWIVGVHALGPQRTSAMMNLVPIITVAIAWAFLGESVHLYHVLGGGLVLIGVGLAQAWRKPLRAAQG